MKKSERTRYEVDYKELQKALKIKGKVKTVVDLFGHIVLEVEE